ncbi:DUF2933 domain-containing protein (plasmid) [Rhizobium rosettiformans]|uniref:DUF2933 domain-containing protein n=1 Tax=Rhizobium rosettiformans TaxID=1368430 RepID=A0ABX7F2T8_9HYPH|nr:DUF2933 domain-containing protein [Rhizobium rosettiformans]QRF54611.1 DUF2933 domain-containing protein [Rhizobium rosettiformans]
MPPKIRQSSNDDQPPRRISATNIVLWGFLAIGAFYLIAEHRANLLGWLPWLIILACPLLHIFMHGRHGGHDHRGGSSSSPSSKRPPHQH